jgi:hypothetical protein
MIKGENVRIMIGGKVVGFAESAQFTFAEDDASTKEFSDPWRTPYIKQSWDITGNAMIQDAGDVVRDLLNGKEKWEIGCLLRGRDHFVCLPVQNPARSSEQDLHRSPGPVWSEHEVPIIRMASHDNWNAAMFTDSECHTARRPLGLYMNQIGFPLFEFPEQRVARRKAHTHTGIIECRKRFDIVVVFVPERLIAVGKRKRFYFMSEMAKTGTQRQNRRRYSANIKHIAIRGNQYLHVSSFPIFVSF